MPGPNSRSSDRIINPVSLVPHQQYQPSQSAQILNLLFMANNGRVNRAHRLKRLRAHIGVALSNNKSTLQYPYLNTRLGDPAVPHPFHPKKIIQTVAHRTVAHNVISTLPPSTMVHPYPISTHFFAHSPSSSLHSRLPRKPTAPPPH